MNLHEAKTILQKADKKNTKLVDWNNQLLIGWLFDLLFKLGAISNQVILCDMYALIIEAEGESGVEYSDDPVQLQLRKETTIKECQKRRKAVTCRIERVPHTYTMIMNAYSEKI